MSEFRCRVGTPDGTIAERFIAAPSVVVAREQLAADGYRVFEIAERARGLWPALRRLGNIRIGGRAGAQEGHRGLFGRGSKVGGGTLLLLNRELAALVNAGLPLLRCIDILRTRRTGTLAGSVMDRVRRRVAGGESLSGAFAPEVARAGIPELFVTSLEVGEASGNLVTAIRRYAEHLESSRALRKRVVAAMTYPIVLLCVAAIVVTILLTVVIPRFAAFYAHSGAQLPLLTRMLVGLAGMVASYGWILLLVLGAGALALVRWARTDGGRIRVHTWALRAPVLGPLRRRYYGLESMRTLSTLLRGGAPLVHALQVTAKGTGNVAYRQRLLTVADQVSEGTNLHSALEGQGLLDPLGLEMVQVGESTGELEEMLEHVASTYDEVLERQVTTAMSLMEPAMLVFMGLLVAGILLSLYLPLFNTVQVVG